MAAPVATAAAKLRRVKILGSDGWLMGFQGEIVYIMTRTKGGLRRLLDWWRLRRSGRLVENNLVIGMAIHIEARHAAGP